MENEKNLEPFLHYSTILESITDSFFALDKGSNFRYVNEGAEKHFARSRKELIGRNFIEEYPQILGKPLHRAFEHSMLTQKPSYLEFESVITGRWYEGRIFPTKDCLSVFFIDITERKKMEEELLLLKKRFLKVFNMSPEVMGIARLADARLIDINETSERITGYSREESIGYTPLELGALMEPGQQDELLRIVRENGFFRNIEIAYRIKSGEIRHGLLSAERISLNEEDVVLYLLNDITDHKKMGEEMARLDRLNIIGQMAAGIGHEIRNPITAIRGFLQMMMGKKELNQYNRYFSTMIEEVDRCNSIITEFLSLAKTRSLHLEEKNINAILGSLYPLMLADALNQDKDIILKRGRNIPSLMVDEKEIRQLILNLVRNGLEAMSSNGIVTIRTYLDGDSVVLSVKDQGKGIQKDILEKLGTPFFSTKPEGTGLGLAVCYSIAARHNASIKIKTNSRGTAFCVRFRINSDN